MQSRDLVETLRLFFFSRSSTTIRDRSPGGVVPTPLHWRRWRNTENGRGLKRGLHDDLSKMLEAISPKPFPVGFNRCHHCLLGTREPYRQIYIKIKNGRVSCICRFVVEYDDIWRHWRLMTQWFHDLISSLRSVKWMSESKSAPHITLEGRWTWKKSAKVIYLIWPQLTSVDLRRTGWPVECMSTTWYCMSTFISLAKTSMFASYVPRNAFSAWHDPSYDVIGQILGGSWSWNFQGGRKKMGGKL